MSTGTGQVHNGWMNDLETLVQPHLIPLLEGQRRVVGYPPSLDVANRRTGPLAQATAQIWPLNGLTHWPTPVLLDDDGLLGLATMWNTQDSADPP